MRHLLGFRGPASVYYRKSGELHSLPRRPDDMLSVHARTEWDRVAPGLHALGLLSEVYGVALASYCEAFADYRSLATEIDDLDACGATVARQLRRQRHADFSRVRSWARKFGFDVDELGAMVLPDAP